MIVDHIAKLGLGLALAVSWAGQAQAGPCLGYEPQSVTLTGVITRHMNYGPPNYGEDPAHDEKETYWRLDLAKPICVKGDSADPSKDANTEDERNIRHLEIVYSNGYPVGPGWVGHRVTVTGTLFHRITGHHHTTVLITAVKTIKAS